jgi:hypothetical protein
VDNDQTIFKGQPAVSRSLVKLSREYELDIFGIQKCSCCNALVAMTVLHDCRPKLCSYASSDNVWPHMLLHDDGGVKNLCLPIASARREVDSTVRTSSDTELYSVRLTLIHPCKYCM